MEPSTTGEPPVRFRAGKKRKAYRQRTDDDSNVPSTALSQQSAETQSQPRDESTKPAAHVDEGSDDEAGVAAALRLRNARRSRLNGVGFKANAKQDDEASGERALVLADGALDKDAALSSVANRFTHQTGLVADMNDKHMMEYIESHLSSRAIGKASNPQDAPAAPTSTHTTAMAHHHMPTAPGPSKKPEGGHAAMQGQLMEIDLGDEARDSNVARTERARQPGGNSADGADDNTGRRAKKPRLGRDGKPWRPRNRRDSDAVKRDQIVEEILRESRLDVYDTTTQQPDRSGPAQDGAADDQLAEQFQQQFLEDVAQRQLKKKKPTAQPGRSGSEDVLKGPKLGGSRNVRAAMRDLLLKKEKEGKK